MSDLNTEQAVLKDENRKKQDNLAKIAALQLEASKEAAFRHTQIQEMQRNQQAQAAAKPAAAAALSISAPEKRPVAPVLNLSAITAISLDAEIAADFFHDAVVELARDLSGIGDEETNQALQQAILDSEEDIQQSLEAAQAISARGPVEVVVAEQPAAATTASAPTLTPSVPAAAAHDDEEEEVVAPEPVVLGAFRSGQVDQKTPVTQVVFLVGKDNNFANALTRAAIIQPDANLLANLSVLATIGKKAPKFAFAQADVQQVLDAVAKFTARVRGPVKQDDHGYVSLNRYALVNNLGRPVVSIPATQLIPGFGSE